MVVQTGRLKEQLAVLTAMLAQREGELAHARKHAMPGRLQQLIAQEAVRLRPVQ